MDRDCWTRPAASRRLGSSDTGSHSQSYGPVACVLQKQPCSVQVISGRHTRLGIAIDGDRQSCADLSRMRSSPNQPKRSVTVPIETLSTKSRFTADRSGIGSSPRSNRTSLASPRMVVVHGAVNVRRSLGMAASRERTTTGRRDISGSPHHHTPLLADRSCRSRSFAKR